MGTIDAQKLRDLACRQHQLLTARQLLDAGLSEQAIRHRVRKGRLFRIHTGVYAVGWPELDQRGTWIAAILACGPGAVLSFFSAAVLLNIADRWTRRVEAAEPTEVTVGAARSPRRLGIRVHRVANLTLGDWGRMEGIPVTSPARTLIDLATRLDEPELERAVNEAAVKRLIQPGELRSDLNRRSGQRGVRPLRDLLDRHSFRMTHSELERWFLPIARTARLPAPETQVWLEGFRVDFAWSSLRLAVETDGGWFHRTSMQQTEDRRREHALRRAGWDLIRFTYHQVRHERDYVRSTLTDVAAQRAIVVGAKESPGWSPGVKRG